MEHAWQLCEWLEALPGEWTALADRGGSGDGGGTNPPPSIAGEPWERRVLLLGLGGGVSGGLALARSGGPDVRTLSYGTGGDVPVFEVGFLYCISTPVVAGTQVASGAIVDCDESHPAELFSVLDTFAYDEQVGYPEGIADFAARGCAMRFESEVVVGDDKADLVATALYPTESEFGRTDDTGDRFDYRQVFCVLARDDGTNIEGSRLAAG